jgi:hypothetical protein
MSVLRCRRGGMGKRAGLKIQCLPLVKYSLPRTVVNMNNRENKKRPWQCLHSVNSLCTRVKGYLESQTGYLALTVIVVVVQEPTYPAGRLCDVIPWPPGPTAVILVVNPALLKLTGLDLI